MSHFTKILPGTAIGEDGRLQSVGIYDSIPLEPAQGEMRLLEIHPGDFDADLECTLFKSSQDSNAVYQALSYHWGDSTRRSLVTVNGQTLSITTNLEVALRHFRHQELRVIIWCDAICINQADVKERNHQVQQMTRIYSSASQVLAWLGPAEGDSDAAMDVLGRIMSDEFATSRKNIRKGFRALIDIFRRPWWLRVWIVQEFAVAQIEPLLCCGHKSLPFTAVIEFIEVMRQIVDDMTTHYECFDMLWIATAEVAGPLLGCRRAYQGSRFGTMRLLLSITTRSQCTDERDKIYAILGLIMQHKESRICVDYSMPVDRLFGEVVKNIIATEDSLDILGFQGSCRRSNFPSWVPDFAAYSRNPTETMCAPFSMVTEGANKGDTRASASGDRRPNIYISQDLTTLRAEGFFFDTIEEVIDLKLEFMVREQSVGTLIGLAYIMRSIKSRAIDIRRQILPTDPRRFPNEPNFNFIPNVFRNENHPLSDLTKLDLNRRWKVFLAEAGIPSDFESGEGPQSRWLAYVWPIVRIFYVWLQKRCVFITSTGSIGLGPSDIRRGDSVVILFGASVPFILRRRADHHILLGDCAVSGIMEGEKTCIFEHGLGTADGLLPQHFTLR